ncbi:hypothetical protein SLH49_00070 [Cognatiyoonia sp. IB215446]|uniref:hypothetical protein n=1 Tax=Cognatiyoonia sp. IB215446 TaxID=3097355 RepID=UPI002A123117|nr:hypothetical protein [Cognatiyoonia sp. IB215446]MDX8346370.1 hypothetical protein [Cognatiyoonia sp. IB215446]
MKKHILDRPRTARKSWIGQALRIEKGVRPHHGSLRLQRRLRATGAKQRTLQYVRIARQDADLIGVHL